MLVKEKFVEKYSNILDGKDVKDLFHHLKNLTNRKEAAELCDLERKTTYYWENSKTIRLETKKKVLRAILEKDFEFTVKYLLSKVYTSSLDVLEFYLGTIYEKAMNPKIPKQKFQELSNEFMNVRIQYSSIINPKKTHRIYRMVSLLNERSKELGTNLPPLPMSTMNVEQIAALLPQLFKIIPLNLTKEQKINYSTRFNIPQEFIQLISELKGLQKVIPSDKITKYFGTEETINWIEIKDSIRSQFEPFGDETVEHIRGVTLENDQRIWSNKDFTFDKDLFFLYLTDQSENFIITDNSLRETEALIDYKKNNKISQDLKLIKKVWI